MFLGGTVALLVRGLTGLTPNSCETYCPFGGVAALFPLLRYKSYTCSLTELNVALLVSLVVLTIGTKKSFCSWVCPFGTVEEWLGKIGKKLMRRPVVVPRLLDLGLMNLRYVVLGLVPLFTWTLWQGDLGFRAYDPFYILFTWGGHGTLGFSFYILIGILVAAVLIPFSWCRYLCPLGATMDPMSRFGALRVRRNQERCTSCGACDEVCPHHIPVSSAEQVTARNCTNCLDCIAACPERGALEASWFGGP